MRRTAWLYIFAVFLSAIGLTLAAFIGHAQTTSALWIFLALIVITTLLRVFRVTAPGYQAYEGSTIGFFAGIILLPFWHFACLVIISHSIEWIVNLQKQTNHLRAWYIQPFNVAKSIISASAAYRIFNWAPLSMGADLAFTDLLTILLAIIIYVALNQGLLGVALYLARNVSFQQAGIVRDALLIEAPLACIGVVAVELVKINPLATIFVFAPILLIYQAFMLPKLQHEYVQSIERVNDELSKANQSIYELNDELFLTLAKIFDARDPYVGGHAAQVAAYAVAIATELELPPERVEVIRQSAYLHDIGKIAIPEAILHKPAKLTNTEYELLKKHTDIGADFISTSHGLRHLAPYIRHHHERWDGRGYPAGLAGETIPLEARILNVCDSVEAMASDRPYHRAMSVDAIIREVCQCAGTQFDPTVAKAFVRIAEREGACFVINSARTVAAQRSENQWEDKQLLMERFAEIYGMVTA